MSRHVESASLYARELGIKKKLLVRLGGEHYLRSLDPDARAILIKPNAGNSRLVDKGGLRARGMRSRVRGIDTAKENLRRASDGEIEHTLECLGSEMTDRRIRTQRALSTPPVVNQERRETL